MKKSELNKLISEYRGLKHKQTKKYVNINKLSIRLKEIEQRYFHEIGNTLELDEIG